jgi:hypothetical protein
MKQNAWWEAQWFGKFQHEEQNKNKLPSLIDKYACIVEELDAKIIHGILFIDKKPLAYIFPTPLDQVQGILRFWTSTFLVQVYILHFVEPLKTTLTWNLKSPSFILLGLICLTQSFATSCILKAKIINWKKKLNMSQNQ